MARIRSIKPEFWTDEDLSELPPETHMLAAALLNHADDEGWFKANPRLVQAACCPLRDDSTSIRRSLDELSRVGYISLYEGPDGKHYGLIRNFSRHQRIDRPSPSKISPMFNEMRPFAHDSTRTRRGLDEGSTPEQGTGNRERGTGSREQGEERGVSHCAPQGGARKATAERFGEFWAVWPRKRDKQKARKAWASKRLDDRADEIIHDVKERMRRDWQWIKDDGEFIPHPTTYLRNERWEDEFTPAPRQGGTATGVDRWLEEQTAAVAGGGGNAGR